MVAAGDGGSCDDAGGGVGVCDGEIDGAADELTDRSDETSVSSVFSLSELFIVVSDTDSSE